jgi:NTP pyrophosphatase (non-canonical NTP hydrolase)
MSNGDTPPLEPSPTDRLWLDCMTLWGPNAQIRQVIEEMAELTVALSHLQRRETLGNYGAVLEELADVTIMINQLEFILSRDHPNFSMELESQITAKMLRLKKLVDESREPARAAR